MLYRLMGGKSYYLEKFGKVDAQADYDDRDHVGDHPAPDAPGVVEIPVHVGVHDGAIPKTTCT